MQKNDPLKTIILFAGPALAFLLGLMLYTNGHGFAAAFTAGLTCLCAIWWIFEPIPIPATSILPLALLPMFGVLTHKEVALSYGDPIILLFMGGFILSTAMEKSGAHRRLALGMVNLIGGHSERRLVTGFMIATAFLSMWISNTATALMMLPIALAVLQSTASRSLAAPLLLGICYAANLGGIATPIGTPPNLVFRKIYMEYTGIEIGFLEWMTWGVPVVLLFLPLMVWWLTRRSNRQSSCHIPAMGKWESPETRVVIIFALTACAWVFRSEPFGGWSALLNLPNANDTSVALLAVLVMFIMPDGKGQRILDWETANKIPWGMLLLFGGGIAIAKAFMSSGLGHLLGEHLQGLAGMPVLIIILMICLIVTFTTEMTSNTATTTLLMPILAIAGAAMNVNPALLMVPAAMSASCAFMLPVATPPNAIIFGSGRVTIKQMVRNGFALNLIGVIVITGVCYVALG